MERIIRRAGVWLVLIVMAAMAFCGCKEKTIKKADENWADVSDKEFEMVGYLFGTKEENKPKYPRSEYFYVVKNNSKITVSIRGTATAYSSDQELEYSNGIAVLGPGETSIMIFFFDANEDQIDHVDCKLMYYKTDLIPVIGNLETRSIKVDDYVSVLVEKYLIEK